jgi:preprotein translocase subunit SecG
MYITIISIILILCVLLILIVMVQNPKGGLSGEFGGSASQMMGVKKTTDLLEKLTYGFMFAIALLATYVNVDIQPSGIEQDAQTEQSDEIPADDTDTDTEDKG